MISDNLIPLFMIMSSFLPALMIFGLAEERKNLRRSLNLIGVVLTLALVVYMFSGVYQGHHYETRFQLLPNIDLVLLAGPIALFFGAL